MSYKWCNDAKLDILHASGQDSKLIFKSDKDTAEVFIEGNDISKVIYTNAEKVFTIQNSEAKQVTVGEGNTLRDVYHYLKPGGPAPEMRLGITKHRSIGTWSSLPHGFEKNLERDFEEVFFYLIEGENKRAVQVGEGVWYDGSEVSTSWFVQDRSFSTIPMGYHPIVGEPGVKVHYIWVYLCKKKEWEKI